MRVVQVVRIQEVKKTRQILRRVFGLYCSGRDEVFVVVDLIVIVVVIAWLIVHVIVIFVIDTTRDGFFNQTAIGIGIHDASVPEVGGGGVMVAGQRSGSQRTASAARMNQPSLPPLVLRRIAGKCPWDNA